MLGTVLRSYIELKKTFCDFVSLFSCIIIETLEFSVESVEVRTLNIPVEVAEVCVIYLEVCEENCKCVGYGLHLGSIESSVVEIFSLIVMFVMFVVYLMG